MEEKHYSHSSERPSSATHHPASTTDLMGSAKVVAEAAKSAFTHHSAAGIDKARGAEAAEDLLDAAKQYGKLEGSGLEQYLDKPEGYLGSGDVSKYPFPSFQFPSNVGQRLKTTDAVEKDTAGASGSSSKEKEAGGAPVTRSGIVDAARSKEAYERIHAKLEKQYKPFDESLRTRKQPGEKAMFLLNAPAPNFIHLLSNMRVRDEEPTVHSIRVFCVENGVDESDIEDASYAGICVCLAYMGALIVTEDPPMPTTVYTKPRTMITEEKISVWKNEARRMISASLAYNSQGKKDGELSWYESYTNVYGRLMSVKRFCDVCEAIIASGYLSEYTKHLTVGEIRRSNTVYTYRFKWLSTPELIITALQRVENETIYRMIDPAALMRYVKFDRGGILAQIASGPLKSFCRGKIDVMEQEVIPDDVTIAELKAIDEAPYDARLIRQAYIIHRVFGTLPNKWYQGMKAKSQMDSKDAVFEYAVIAFRKSEKEAARKLIKASGSQMEEKDIVGEVEDVHGSS